MKIIQCMLDTTNSLLINNTPLGDRIKTGGVQELWSKRPSVEIDVVVIHYISALNTNPLDPFSIDAILEIFCEFRVSSHYLIERTGTVYSLVPEEQKAWHCGGSIMPPPDNRQSVNNFSIGIELVATPDSGFTEAQYDSLAYLCKTLEKKWPIKQYVGHEHIAGDQAIALGLRTDCKIDPGKLFNWNTFFHTKDGLIV